MDWWEGFKSKRDKMIKDVEDLEVYRRSMKFICKSVLFPPLEGEG